MTNQTCLCVGFANSSGAVRSSWLPWLPCRLAPSPNAPTHVSGLTGEAGYSNRYLHHKPALSVMPSAVIDLIGSYSREVKTTLSYGSELLERSACNYCAIMYFYLQVYYASLICTSAYYRSEISG